MIANIDGARACGPCNNYTCPTDMKTAINRESEAALQRLISTFRLQRLKMGFKWSDAVIRDRGNLKYLNVAFAASIYELACFFRYFPDPLRRDCINLCDHKINISNPENIQDI